MEGRSLNGGSHSKALEDIWMEGAWVSVGGRQGSVEAMPGSAFLLFAKSRREEVKEKHPEVDGTGITKLLGQEWKKLSEEAKQ